MPAPPSTSGSIVDVKQPAKQQTADDINELFKEIDNEPEVREESEKADKKTREQKEEKEIEEDKDDELELKEPDEDVEKLDLTKIDDYLDISKAFPKKKEILKEYPDLFKKFPSIEAAIYRDRQITELFGSFDDAKEVAEKSEIFNQFENELLTGNTERILREVKETDKKAFDTIVDDYLPTLAKVDKEAYFHVTGNLNKRLIMEMVQEANDTNNDDLRQAALLVNQFVFGTAKFTAPSNRVEKREDSAKDEAEQERLSFVQERFETHRDDLQSQVNNTLRATISDYIDPKGAMSAYVKKNAVADAMRILQDAIADDPSVSKNLNNLWRAAFDNRFAKNNLDRIKSFYLSKAKANLKNAILKARAEALKDARPSHNEKETDNQDEEREQETARSARRIPSGRPAQPKSDRNGQRKGESVTDFFMRD